MKVLVTGGLGYIGSLMCVQLIKSQFEPIIIDNLINSKPSVLTHISKVSQSQPVFYEGDIRNRALLNSIFSDHDIEAVIHFAGLKAVGESVCRPAEYYNVNVEGTLALAESMIEHKVKNIIFSSSATVYGDPSEVPLTEESKVGKTTNPYASSKYFVERILGDIQKANPNWSVTILRYFNPIGAHESGLLGEDPKGIPNNLVPFVAQVATGKRPKLSVFGNDYDTPDGTGVRDYIHVSDLADGHLAALKKKTGKPGTHVYNLGTGVGTSVLEIIASFSRSSQKTIHYEICQRRPGDVASYWAAPQKAERELGWKASKTIATMTDDVWRWQSRHPDGYPEG